uniref:B30.2/SPRY domain-containing protein n=1 Tax=Cyanistes caeruleus TaxID=156563 RepID=A0A8C0VEE6_CYACU
MGNSRNLGDPRIPGIWGVQKGILGNLGNSRNLGNSGEILGIWRIPGIWGIPGFPSLTLSGCFRFQSGSRALWVSGKHYWEVELGSGSGWELGVLAEEIRDSLRDDSVPSVPEEKVAGLEYSQGEFRLPGGKLERNSGRCRVLGLFLDQENGVLSFFDVEEKQLLGSLPLRISGNLFPFFRPGWDGNTSGIVSVKN